MMIFEDIYKESTASIKQHKVSNKIPKQKKVGLSDTIFPKLFTAALQDVFNNLNYKEAGIQI